MSGEQKEMICTGTGTRSCDGEARTYEEAVPVLTVSVHVVVINNKSEPTGSDALRTGTSVHAHSRAIHQAHISHANILAVTVECGA
jgi:hypothetical protein